MTRRRARSKTAWFWEVAAIPLVLLGGWFALKSLGRVWDAIMLVYRTIVVLFRVGRFYGNLLGDIVGHLLWAAIFAGIAYWLIRRWGKRALLHVKGDWPLPPVTEREVAIASGRKLSELRDEADTWLINTDQGLSPGEGAMNGLQGQQINPAAAIVLLFALPFMIWGQRFKYHIRALMVRHGNLELWEKPGRHSRDHADELISSGDAMMVQAWSVPIAEVPEAIEVGSARDHIPNMRLDWAAKFEDVYFMYRGRRLLLARIYNTVRDAISERQYEIREFIQTAQRKLGPTPSAMPLSAAKGTSAKGFEL